MWPSETGNSQNVTKEMKSRMFDTSDIEGAVPKKPFTNKNLDFIAQNYQNTYGNYKSNQQVPKQAMQAYNNQPAYINQAPGGLPKSDSLDFFQRDFNAAQKAVNDPQFAKSADIFFSLEDEDYDQPRRNLNKNTDSNLRAYKPPSNNNYATPGIESYKGSYDKQPFEANPYSTPQVPLKKTGVDYGMMSNNLNPKSEDYPTYGRRPGGNSYGYQKGNIFQGSGMDQKEPAGPASYDNNQQNYLGQTNVSGASSQPPARHRNPFAQYQKNVLF